MSLEDKIKDLTAAVENLTAAFIAHTNDAAPAKASKPAEAKAEPKAEKPKAEKKPAVKAAEVEKMLDAEAAAEAVTYPMIQALIKANAATKRPAIMKVLAKFGISSATELLEEQWAPFYTDLSAELGAEAELA